MNLDKLEQLKERLAKAPKLADVYEYFLDHFGDHAAFFNEGKPAQNEILAAVLSAVAQQMCGPKAAITHLMLVRIADHHFIHGGCMINGRIATTIYFDDIDVGLLVLMAANRGESTQFSRFSGRKVPPDYVPSKN